jgi:hypothetical protein
MLLATVAAADAPQSLTKGHWSLGYNANSGSTIQFGYGVADMTRIIGSLGIQNEDPGNGLDSNTEFGISGEFRRYIGGMSNNYFSPFFGLGVGVNDSGIEGDDSDFQFFGGFGGDAFVIEPLAIGGFVGLGYTKEGDFDHDNDPTTPKIEGETTFGTLRSAITATLFWGGE